MISMPNTDLNRRFAATVARRLKSDATITFAQAAMWRSAGIGMMVMLGGIGIGAAFFGYSYVSDNRSAADRIAAALTQSLSQAVIKAEGTVRMEEDSTVRLAEDAVMTLAADSTVKIANPVVTLDPASRAGIGGGTGGGPGLPTGQGFDRTQQGATVATEITVFKTVPYDTGKVVTVWLYDPTNLIQPKRQQCQYRIKTDGGVVQTVELGFDAEKVRSPMNPIGLDLNAAYKNCVWYKPQG